MDDLITKLARACCRGWRQESFVNELLTGEPVNFEIDRWESVKYGVTQLSHSSWKGLRSRLTRAGFVIVSSRWTVQLKYPEQTSRKV